jgi:tRNA-splicing ligase RtcB
MTPDYPAILARLDSLDEHVAKRLAGRLLRLRSAVEPGFLEAISSIVANPAASLAETWAELEPMRDEILAIRNRQRLLTPRAAPIDYRIYGADAHVGYGMPIGGVAAVENAVIPYAVGVDIGCRMHLTVFREPTTDLERLRTKLRESILKGTHFGRALRPRPLDHPLLDDPRLAQAEKHLQKQDLRTRAALQFGTSGGGNHFVEFGELRLHEAAEGIPAGNWIALLTHSGSRALGFNIAHHFSTLAKRLTPLPKELERLAWLPMDTEEGRAYWDSMEVAGEYSAANHQVIHDTVVALSGLTPVRAVSNHHNFAWKENHGGKELFVHRKGATPAAAGVLGIIPGSMGAPGFLVRGRGAADSLASASHGAGRQMSRTQALNDITAEQRDAHLSAAKVELLGGGLDEAPGAYKDIRAVIGAQADLVEILAEFHPRIVRMAGAVEADPEEGN